MAGIKVCNQAPSITHMFFADDSYLYCKATIEEANRVLEMLRIFETASGQKVNTAKSSVFFSTNMRLDSKRDICGALDMMEADERSTYLGLPNILGRNKSALLGFLKDKVTKRVECWNGKLISKPGKEVLIKSVAQALPSYAMSVFLLPLEITKDIERTIAKYWWNSGPNASRGIHWMSWERMCRHKSTGGLGFRNFRDFNLALLGKQGWRFLHKPDSLVSRVYKARYFPSGNFLSSSLGNNPSFVWRSVWEAKDLVKAGVKWQVGNGDSIEIVGQPWLDDDQNPYITSTSQAFQKNKVSALMNEDHSAWDLEVINDLFNLRDQECIKRMQLNENTNEDKLYWSKEASGFYSVKSAYRLLQARKGLWCVADNNSLWKRIWKLKAPPKVLNLIWRALAGCLPTYESLQQKRVSVVGTCPVCEDHVETVLHIFVQCPFAVQCWQSSFPDVVAVIGEDFYLWLEQVLGGASANRGAEIITVCWAIWRARNDKVWRQVKARANSVVSSAMQYLIQWKNAQSRSFQAVSQFHREGDGVHLWVKPQADIIKVTVDAAVFQEHAAFGIGFVARDSDGSLVQAISKLFHGNVPPEMAEGIAIREALSWLKDKAWGKVEVESDCQVAVQAIRSKVLMISPFGKVVHSCRSMLSELQTTSLLFIKRSANEAAHYIARESLSFPDRVLDRRDVPIEFFHILQADLAH